MRARDVPWSETGQGELFQGMRRPALLITTVWFVSAGRGISLRAWKRPPRGTALCGEVRRRGVKMWAAVRKGKGSPRTLWSRSSSSTTYLVGTAPFAEYNRIAEEKGENSLVVQGVVLSASVVDGSPVDLLQASDGLLHALGHRLLGHPEFSCELLLGGLLVAG